VRCVVACHVLYEPEAGMIENTDTTERSSFRQKRRRELLTFVVLAFGIWPLVAVAVVGGYGFTVWMYQIVNGPPGAHDVVPARPNSAE
jgi:nitrate reductase NapE